MHFGEPLSDARLQALLRPGEGIDTVITADAYGAGEADRLLGGQERAVHLRGGRGGDDEDSTDREQIHLHGSSLIGPRRGQG